MAKLFKWGSFSLLGHIVLSEIFFATPLSLMFLYLNYREGALTASWALHIALYGAVLGIAFAVLLWYIVSLPLIKQRRDR